MDLLTPKEREIVDLVIQGQSSREIATSLDISVRTVENHRARIMDKLHIASAVELVKLFM
jgi:DNA-binding CsgD family transcriptional regulator